MLAQIFFYSKIIYVLVEVLAKQQIYFVLKFEQNL